MRIFQLFGILISISFAFIFDFSIEIEFTIIKKWGQIISKLNTHRGQFLKKFSKCEFFYLAHSNIHDFTPPE